MRGTVEACYVYMHVFCVESSTCCRWISNLLSMLAAHANLHWPIYLRLKELLTTQVGRFEDIQVILFYNVALAISCLR